LQTRNAPQLTNSLGSLQPPPSAPQPSTTPPLPPHPPPPRPPRILLMLANQRTTRNLYPPTLPTFPSPLKVAMAIASANTASQRTRTSKKFARANSQARNLTIMCRRIRRASLEAISRSSRMGLEGRDRTEWQCHGVYLCSPSISLSSLVL
jgi:hypothetical protein